MKTYKATVPFKHHPWYCCTIEAGNPGQAAREAIREAQLDGFTGTHKAVRVSEIKPKNAAA